MEDEVDMRIEDEGMRGIEDEVDWGIEGAYHG
jgi:hypothetical protein